MEACSPIVARHIGAAQDCEYEMAWANTCRAGIHYTATATRCGYAVLNRLRAPMSRLVRALAAVLNVRAAAFRQSLTGVGIEGLAAVATSTTTQTTLGGLAFNGLDGVAPTGRGLLCDAQKGFAFVVDCTQAKEFALAHWLVNGADGGRVFVRCFGGDGTVQENAADDVLASPTTMVWNAPSKSWTGNAAVADTSLNRRMTARLDRLRAGRDRGHGRATGAACQRRPARPPPLRRSPDYPRPLG